MGTGAAREEPRTGFVGPRIGEQKSYYSDFLKYKRFGGPRIEQKLDLIDYIDFLKYKRQLEKESTSDSQPNLQIAGFNFATQCSVSRSATRSGCMFPDYCSDNRHSDKSDVFSFGFILLELITGKKPFFSAVDQSPHLATWIMPPLKNALNKCDYTALVDPTLGNQYSKEEMGRMIHCAAACIYKLERNRPQMKEIVQVLEGDMSMKLIWQHEKDKHYIRTLLC
ncbi:putative proline-rich receptor-like protein kinase PERK6 [Euphorbia lathyris]|uniref:putative proline-rich receptor-like protein kinase PERK6 n=1 Tax=Euphorbia lathyris TaxID=212925 RepID=UPI003313AEA4